MQKTTMLKKEETKDKKWYLIDATDLVLGRLAVIAANVLRGKEKPTFTPNVDCGDYLVIVNTDKILVTGNKKDNEYVYNHSQYIGGLTKRSYREMIDKYSDELVRDAIKNMLPKNKLSSKIIQKLHTFKNSGHPHEAQKPIEYKVKK